MKAHTKARTVILIAATLSLSLAAAAANAHPHHGRDGIDRGYGHYGHGYRHGNAQFRSRHMPRRLHHDKRFRRWYRHSAIRHNPYLPWWKVYRVYERQMAPGHYRHDDRLRRYGNHRRYDDHGDYYDDDRPRRRKRS
jgi:hypothetical protein